MKPRLLCVDDRKAEHILYEVNLGDEYELLTAMNSAEARESIASHNDIDGILMDYQIKMENGIFLAGELKEEGFEKSILMVSREILSEDLLTLFKEEYGFFDFVLKEPEHYKPKLAEMLRA